MISISTIKITTLIGSLEDSVWSELISFSADYFSDYLKLNSAIEFRFDEKKS